MINFKEMQPQMSDNKIFFRDFEAGYNAVLEKLKDAPFDRVRDELNSIYPAPYKASSMAAYFYMKGEFAAIMDNR